MRVLSHYTKRPLTWNGAGPLSSVSLGLIQDRSISLAVLEEPTRPGVVR
jgi:hypothetical protein